MIEGLGPRRGLPGDAFAQPSGSMADLDALYWTPRGARRDPGGPLRRVMIVDTAPWASGNLRHAASWLASEAAARRLEVLTPALELWDENLQLDVEKGDLALLLLYRYGPGRPLPAQAVPWERWSQITEDLVAQGARVAAVAAGASPAAVAACVKAGADLVVAIDRAAQVLDLLAPGKEGAGHLTPWAADSSGGGGLAEQLERLAQLTTIEQRVLFHLTRGCPAGRIAVKQQMSLSTVRAHIRSILRKLGVRSQLTAVALAQGVVASDAQEATADDCGSGDGEPPAL